MKFKNLRKTMIDKDVTPKDLAESSGYSQQHTSGVINGRLDSPRAKKIIALILGEDFDYLWATESQTEKTI